MVRLERVVLDAAVWVRSAIQKDLDEIEMIHVRLRHRIVATLDITVVRRQIEGRPAALVGDVHVGAALDQIGRQLVVPVVRRGEQRSPAILGRLVHVGASVEQQFGGLRVAFAGRKDQRSQAAAS